MSAKPLKYKQLANATAVKTVADLLDATLLSGGIPVANVHYAEIQPETQNVRWTTDGATPTTTSGNLLAAGDTRVFTRGELIAIKLIEVAANAVVNVQPFQNG